MVDGKVLPMPLARGFEYPYKKEHWLPMILVPTKNGIKNLKGGGL